MALRIKSGKVINVTPPSLTAQQVEKMEKASVPKRIIAKATSRTYNIVYK